MSLSVNTNPGALVALQNLTSTASQLQQTQNEVSTGLAIASPQDNGAIWAIAQNERGTSGSLDSVIQSLQRSQSTVQVATSAGTSVSNLLNQLKIHRPVGVGQLARCDQPGGLQHPVQVHPGADHPGREQLRLQRGQHDQVRAGRP